MNRQDAKRHSSSILKKEMFLNALECILAVQSVNAFWRLGGNVVFWFALGASIAVAQEYPTRPIRIITGSPGSTADLSARFMAQKLTERWGQQAVVDNRPGAGGIIGVEIAARSAPDGYTLVIGHVGTHASAPALFKSLPYDPVRDFAPLSNVVNVGILLVVHPSIPATTLKDFVAYAQSKPGAINYGSPGGGTSGNLTGELVNLVTKARMTHVPYKGAGFAVTGVVSGETQASFLATSTAFAQVRAGKLRALAVIRKTRFPAMADVPSAAEAGYPDLDANAWFGLFAPAKTPKAVVAKLNQEMVRVLGQKDVQELLLKQGAETAPTSPEEFGAYVKSEIVKWTRVVKESGVQAN
jgi:tripartite-type tricarboxylate transporter receptor subunit TctC